MLSELLDQPTAALNRRRRFLKWLAGLSLSLLSDLHIEGAEHLPNSGPLIVASNHFHFGDPAAIVHMAPWPIEFIGDGLVKAADIVQAGGVLFVAPEAGSWAAVLRPPRPGVSFLAACTGARVLPVGLFGLNDIFPSLRRGRRARVTIRIGPPCGPFAVNGRGRQRRRQVDEIGHVIMRHIAALIPPEQRGYYSDDPAIRAAAAPAAVYPWREHGAGAD